MAGDLGTSFLFFCILTTSDAISAPLDMQAKRKKSKFLDVFRFAVSKLLLDLLKGTLRVLRLDCTVNGGSFCTCTSLSNC